MTRLKRPLHLKEVPLPPGMLRIEFKYWQFSPPTNQPPNRNFENICSKNVDLFTVGSSFFVVKTRTIHRWKCLSACFRLFFLKFSKKAVFTLFFWIQGFRKQGSTSNSCNSVNRRARPPKIYDGDPSYFLNICLQEKDGLNRLRIEFFRAILSRGVKIGFSGLKNSFLNRSLFAASGS